jgi:crotonobetainyl-CoA:carnitine CoA-transferase CaiB-like acyl-CoA transferase
MDLVRAVDAPPANSMPAMGDHPTGMSLFGAIMLALFQRERTGRGACVSTSLLANGAWANGILLQALLCGATLHPKRPRDRARNPLGNLYQTRDGRWFLLTVMRDDREWARLATGIGRPDLLEDPRFGSRDARREHAAELVAILEGVFAARDWAEWRRVLEEGRITSGPVARLADLPDDPQLRDNGVLVPLESEGRSGRSTVASPISMSGQEKRAPRPAPLVGEHTDEILRAAGYDGDTIARPRARNVIG